MSLVLNPQLAGWLTIHTSPLLARQFDRPTFEGEELLASGNSMFPHRLTQGYDNLSLAVVSQVTGTPVKSLLHFVEVLRACEDEYTTFEFAGIGYETPGVSYQGNGGSHRTHLRGQ